MLVKRGIVGIYHNVSREYLHRYLWQYDFLWNRCRQNDGERTVAAVNQQKASDSPTKPHHTMRKIAKKKPAKTGPKPDALKIEGKWQDAAKKSLSKKKPAQGWPKMGIANKGT